MPDMTLPTPDEVAAMRERHVESDEWPGKCAHDAFDDWPCDAARLLALVDSLHSWRGLMALMDEHWPADIFPMGDEPPSGPGDPGPRILALARWVDRLQGRLAAVLAECDRYDQGEGDIEPEDGWRLLRDIRRAAAGQGS